MSDIGMVRDGHFPDDMDPLVRFRLKYDLMLFGTAIYEDADGHYKRIDPATVTLDEDGNVSGFDNASAVVDQTTDDYYGKPLTESLTD